MTCSNFPEELTSLRQWLVWRLEPNPTGKKPRKVPYYVNGNRRTGTQGSDDDRAALTDYETAAAVLSGGEYTGLGFALLTGDGLVGIDLDGITESPERAERAQKIIDACNSYTEHSPSGNGVHIFCRGQTETFKSNLLGIEVFSGKQFLTMTGQPYGEPRPVRDVPSETFQKLKRTVRKEAHDGTAPAPMPPAQSTGDKIDDALAYVSPDCGYDDWLRIGMALHAELGDSGLPVWDAWSARSAKYPGNREVATHWRSFRAGGGVTIGTLYGMAKESGWKPPRQPRGEPVRTVSNDRPATVDHAADIHSPLPDVKGNGKPMSTIENVAEVCRRLGVTVRYNVISKEEEIIIPGQGFSQDNAGNASLAWLNSWCARFGMPTDKLGDYVTFLADTNQYNPVAAWIQSKEWDRKHRAHHLCATIKAAGEDTSPDSARLKNTLIRRWLLSAVAAAFEPEGVAAGGILVLQGAQNMGKTKWFKSLVPADLGVIQDGMMLRPDDRDSVRQVCGFWLVELGELDATFRKADIAALKAFITRKNDVIRRAYARKESHYARRTVMFASVNDDRFLNDPTGNRRFWTIECEAIDHTHGLDMQQVWAEVYEDYRAGETWYLDADEVVALNQHNENFMQIDPIEERISSRLNWDEKQTFWRWIRTTDLLIEVGVDRPTHQDVIRGGTALKKRDCPRKKVNGSWLIFAPPRIQSV